MRKPFKSNVGGGERWLSVAAGTGVVAWGLSRRGWVAKLATLGGASLMARGATGYCPLYAGLGINRLEKREATPRGFRDRGIRVEEAIAIHHPPAKLYQRWRKLETLPQILPHVESVTLLDDRRSHWVVRGPAGMKLEWDAEIFNDELGRRISWKSLPAAEVHHVGSLNFVPLADDSTLMRVTLEYIPPGGKLGAWAAALLGADPAGQVREDLRKFKVRMEGSAVELEQEMVSAERV